ncbi:hypothetical protein [Streptomyces sp. NBC_01187]|uniref:hypothetical protein n=1 Tax=Streptomyces sp. NBC_01187 TaxID=2903766 RepID=UPI002F90E75F|nr:hypothetical protein OG220_40545 [Streptomyces sp. NBC_01187]WSS46935.1 hypothetical protein OG220_41080 [Streptomyces sp. NBC_01187]
MTPPTSPAPHPHQIEAADPQLAVRTAHSLAMPTGGGGPTDPELTGDGTVQVWLYARPEGSAKAEG